MMVARGDWRRYSPGGVWLNLHHHRDASDTHSNIYSHFSVQTFRENTCASFARDTASLVLYLKEESSVLIFSSVHAANEEVT